MSSLQEIFNRIKESKKEQKIINKSYKDVLESSKGYKEILDQLKELKAKKKQIEDTTRADFSTEFARLDTLKSDIQNDMELLSDMALNQLLKGQSVSVTDEYETKYDPMFTVRFKKS